MDRLRRFAMNEASAWTTLAQSSAAGPGSDDNAPFDWVSPIAVHVGTQVHRELHRAGRSMDQTGDLPPLLESSARLDNELRLLGVPDTAIAAAAERVRDAVGAFLKDPRGRWILHPHLEAQSELKLSQLTEAGLTHLQLDRTFVDEDGVRWIIDYKTSRHSGGDLDRFLAAEIERYAVQLNRYARAMAELDARPIRVALYFPLLGEFRHWQPDLAVETIPTANPSV
jgi:ATP-dependent exoDNAse (exonuclease V) beta subunit